MVGQFPAIGVFMYATESEIHGVVGSGVSGAGGIFSVRDRTGGDGTIGKSILDLYYRYWFAGWWRMGYL